MLRCRKSSAARLLDGWPRTDHRRLPPRGAVRHSLLVRERELQFADLQPALLSAARRWRPPCACAKSWPNSGALLQMQEMAARYGCDISHLARTAREAVQWLYRSPTGGGEVAERRRHVAGARHLPRHLYRTRSARRFVNEEQAQELIDHFIMKIRMVRFCAPRNLIRCSPGSHLGDGGAGRHGAGWSHPVSKTTFRYLHTLHTMGPAPEPNLTVLWSRCRRRLKICRPGLYRHLVAAV